MSAAAAALTSQERGPAANALRAEGGGGPGPARAGGADRSGRPRPPARSREGERLARPRPRRRQRRLRLPAGRPSQPAEAGPSRCPSPGAAAAGGFPAAEGRQGRPSARCRGLPAGSASRVRSPGPGTRGGTASLAPGTGRARRWAGAAHPSARALCQARPVSAPRSTHLVPACAAHPSPGRSPPLPSCGFPPAAPAPALPFTSLFLAQSPAESHSFSSL
ncbi:uncharacterized protein LOC141729277 [Zonotrichia albicollis]|uniref:uncharacterized protein LOC141729277 n=1 Tax=Zonotrichia albicollis TaxID=44394 RepID=UPI003D80EC54